VERYDNQNLENLQIAAAKLESGTTFELPSRRRPNGEERPRRKPARATFQESFKYEGTEPRSRTVREVPPIEPNELENLNLADWLGGRDSNSEQRLFLTW
jgi:hypothetical protein